MCSNPITPSWMTCTALPKPSPSSGMAYCQKLCMLWKLRYAPFTLDLCDHAFPPVVTFLLYLIGHLSRIGQSPFRSCLVLSVSVLLPVTNVILLCTFSCNKHQLCLCNEASLLGSPTQVMMLIAAAVCSFGRLRPQTSNVCDNRCRGSQTM